MIGQKNLIQNIDMLLSQEVLPRFILLSGDRGSGRKLIASSIAQKIGGHSIKCGISVDEIRNMVDLVNCTTDKMVVIIADADDMSVAAKNVLLKVTEEPPNNTVFVMTVEDEYFMPDTLRSRATLLRMDTYSPDEIVEIAMNIYEHLSPQEVDIVINICRTPGEVIGLVKSGVIEFWEYMIKVIDNIDTVSVANSFKIAQKVALKPDAEGYNLKLFWRAFMILCTEQMTFNLEHRVKFAMWVKITSTYMQMLRTKGVNMQMVFDSWMLDIRGAE